MLAIAAGAALAAGAVGHAQADVIVLKSSVPGLSAGRTLTDAETLEIPAGKSALLVLPSGATKTVNGPLSTKVASLTTGHSPNAALLDAVRKYVETGGTRTGAVGATRSAVPTLAAAPKPFSWTEVPLSVAGDYCVDKGSPLALVRDVSSGDLDVTVIDLQNSIRARAHFPSGSKRARWPAEIEPTVGKYAFVIGGQPLRQIRLRPIDPLPGDEETLRVLFTQRCESQVEAYLQALR